MQRIVTAQGQAGAQYGIGKMYYVGQGVPQNYAEAVKWYRLAAGQGVENAYKLLATIYSDGLGVPQNYSEAAMWHSLSAEQGDTNSQLQLGGMYMTGQGVPQDYIESHKWFNLAAANGSDLGRRGREIAAKRMTSADISEAQLLARGTGLHCRDVAGRRALSA